MRKIVLALSIGMLIGTTATATATATATVAASSTESVQATIAKFVFKVKGEEKVLTNDPLVVEGTSYLPVREVATLFGYQLQYDETTRTINFDDKRNDTKQRYEVLTQVPDLSEWVEVQSLITFYKENDMKASLASDSFSTSLTLGSYGVGFPFSFEEQYKDGDVPKHYAKSNGKISVLVYKNNIYVNKSKIKNLEFPIEDEWMPLTDLKGALTKLDTSPLKDVIKLEPVFLYTDKGIIRAVNSKKGILLNKLDAKARGIID
ncbi:hypothetical protein GK047_20470 [Paenibacillus sp. SYP-B3998]|uniref:Copper amine oxidase-like N-terminal domain-containing protein n=1 Tax=Paenibacillus sp. SYP-B3998 TaxID=2678564 RepID=A0A6G4A1W8_9BACL|nr:stalk domain-containing protein [Paenibacillus sp. SYP-B3998]NEW08375.1 hypothetical protein [Paenibacillus sp. SYP-B3998]